MHNICQGDFDKGYLNQVDMVRGDLLIKDYVDSL